MTNVSQPMKSLARRWMACLLASLLAGCAGTGSDRGVVVTTPGGTPQHVDIPRDHYPPPGTCRIWVPGMAPGLQSAPDDCDRLKHIVPQGAVLVRG
jgi:hypothetical protein